MATESRTLVLLALVANGIIAVMKFVAAGISGSSAMLAEGFHSVADTGNQVFLLRGHAVSRYEADVAHPFGRGKEVYFWSFMVAVFLFVGGSVVAIIQGWNRLMNPAEPHNFALNMGVLALAAIFEYFIAFRPAVREFNRSRGGRKAWPAIRDGKDPALLVVLFEDAAAMVGVAIAMLGVAMANLTNDERWDGAASIAIGLLLAATAWLLAYETKKMLVGESASREDRSAIRAAALSVPEVSSIGRLLTMHIGPEKILVNMEADFEDGLSGDQIEEAVDSIEQAVQKSVPQVEQIFIELESP